MGPDVMCAHDDCACDCAPFPSTVVNINVDHELQLHSAARYEHLLSRSLANARLKSVKILGENFLMLFMYTG